jgi:hypothetical protein
MNQSLIERIQAELAAGNLEAFLAAVDSLLDQQLSTLQD